MYPALLPRGAPQRKLMRMSLRLPEPVEAKGNVRTVFAVPLILCTELRKGNSVQCWAGLLYVCLLVQEVPGGVQLPPDFPCPCAHWACIWSPRV